MLSRSHNQTTDLLGPRPVFANISSWLIEAESAGVIVEPGAEVPERNSRLRVQTEAFFLEVAPEKAAHLARHVDEGLLTLEDLDNIADEVGSIASGTLKLVFGAASPLELIIEFASSGNKDAKLIEKNALGELRGLVRGELGMDFGAASTPVEARKTLRRLAEDDEPGDGW